MANVKPGDLAIIVRKPRFDSRAFMAPVTVLRPAAPMRLKSEGDALVQAWRVESKKPFLTKNKGTGIISLKTVFRVPDAYLRRIPPDVLEDETTEVKEKETT